MPQMGIKGEDLFNIQGTPPNLFTEIHGDAFAPRNPQALKIDFVKRPPYFTVSPTHKAKTWLLDPRAPKVEPPAAVKLLKEEGDAGCLKIVTFAFERQRTPQWSVRAKKRSCASKMERLRPGRSCLRSRTSR